MLEARDLRSRVEAAEQAAAAGDYASAAERLREAAALQETHLGPLHPDLANTLNNLGVAYEKADRPGDAERCYRRAFAIASAVLEADHPFVATSRQNLQDFCAARGKPFQPPSRPVTLRGFSRQLAIGALSACALVLALLLLAFRPWSGGNQRAEPSSSSVAEPVGTSGAPTPKPVPAEPSPVFDETPPGRSLPADVPQSPTTAAAAPPTVIDARLCERLSTGTDWQCDPATSPVAPGPLFFYTRVLSSNDTTIGHRWYRGDRLHQAVDLGIRANPGAGYRTYSRNTVSAEASGDWRVELRTADGMLLHEQRFVVR